MARALLLLLLGCASCATPGSSLSAGRDAYPLQVELEAGALWQSRNDVRIPNEGGTRFSLEEVSGDDEYPIARLTADWDLDPRHSLRFVLAPLELDGTGELEGPTVFAGETFAAGTPTDASYRFNSYRVGYRYTFLHDERWRLRVGGTLFVRDAEIELVQGATRASDSDVGVVPLLAFAAEYYPAQRWSLIAELDGLASSQGRAFDFTARARYDLTDTASLGLAYRTIEGGADTDEVYSFAWLHSVVATFALRF